jgi:hypothetical protein
MSDRTFEEDLAADRRFERALFVRGMVITAGVAALVVVRGLLL